MSKLKKVIIRTGTVEEFFDKARTVFKALDKGKVLKESSKEIIFEDPMEMLHFLTATKLKLINTIRLSPDSISNIAKKTKRNRAAVSRDVAEMEKFGLINTRQEINPGHGMRKIVSLASKKLDLRASI